MGTFRNISLPSHPRVWGVASLGNLSGKSCSYRRYLRSNNAVDMRNDWETVGKDIYMAVRRYRKTYGKR